MERDAAEVLRDALALAPDARASLIDSPIGSLDSEVDVEAEAAWLEEVGRRIRESESGVVELIPWDEARQRLRFRLKP